MYNPPSSRCNAHLLSSLLTKSVDTLQQIQHSQSSATSDITQVLSSMNQLNQGLLHLRLDQESKLQGIETAFLGAEARKRRQDILAWLWKSEVSTSYHSALGARERGTNTGTWFLESTYFKHWTNHPSSLWIYGDREYLSKSCKT